MESEILEILKHEDIRVVDGRYSDGFVDDNELKKLISSGKVETYCVSEFKFARLPHPED
jgi:hypothetical protein